MRGRRRSPCHSVKQYEIKGMKYVRFIFLCLKFTYYFFDIFFAYVLDFFLVINRKQIDAGFSSLKNNVQSYHPQSAAFSATFAFNAKTNLALATSQRNACLWILFQFMLKHINVISKRVITFGQTLGLTQKFLSIIKGYHEQLCFCSKFINQCIKRVKTFSCKTSFLCFTITFGYGFIDKGLFCLNLCIGCAQSVDSHPFYSSQNLFQTWYQAGILDIQYYLCHNLKRFAIPAQNYE